MRHLRSIALRLFRAAVIVALVLIIHHEHRWLEAQHLPGVSLAEAQRFFPNASRLGPRDLERGGYYVFGNGDEPLGYVLTTSPETDDLIGYSGPSNVLVAIGPDGAVIGTEILGSRDTPEHLELVKKDERFRHAFDAWRPSDGSLPRIDGVSGATLTSAAIAEGIERRLAGRAPSLRFPDPVSLAEVRELFPDAARTETDGPRLRVLDAQGAALGFAVRTSPWSDNVSGYQGPTESLVALRPDGRTVAALRIRKSYDTPEYVDSVKQDAYWMKRLFAGKTTDELVRMQWDKAGVEGVSGATQTSNAMFEGLKRRFAAEIPATRETSRLRARDWGLVAVIAGAMLMAFTHLRGSKWARRAWQAVLIGYVGLASGDLLSLALMGGWAQSGLAWSTLPGLVLLVAVSLLVPLATGRQIYCHQVCPHGAAQQWLGAVRKRKLRVPGWLNRGLEAVPFILLLVAVVVLVRDWPLNLASIEPFDAWVWKAAGIATIVIALLGLVASVFVPQAYCRYGCPTGALLRLVWSHGSGDRFGWRDWIALGLVAIAFLIRPSLWSASAPPTAGERTVFRGAAMGTTWRVKLDRPAPPSLQREIEACLDRLENLASTWRPRSAISRFNDARSTEPQLVPAELAALAASSARVSRASDGAFDITVAPLVRLWHFGAGSRPGPAPLPDAVAEARARVGWEKLEINPTTLRKRDPALTLDMSAIAEGHAVDEVFALLGRRGHERFLVEAGGELRARGAWTIAIEHPWRVVTLRDQAIATSGTYRQHWRDGSRERSHLIDPRTGRPIEHSTVSVSVLAPTCAEADAWATALNVLGVDAGSLTAQREDLAAQFVSETTDHIDVRSTPAWPPAAPDGAP